MAHAHDLPISRPSINAQGIGQAFALNRQGVIAGYLKLLGQAFKQTRIGVRDGGGLAVHDGLGA